MFRGRRACFYIFREMLPIFLMGALVFVLILLMFQALRLTEFVLVHGVSYQTLLKIMLYLSISFLPAILPMSLLFSVLLTYGRLSSDSEIVAMKSVGLNMKHLTLPALVLGLLVSALSAKLSFEIAPWGNRQFEVLISQIGQSKASVAIREGVFSEGFFNLVVYANKVDSKKGLLKDVFIYDERNEELPLTIIARDGEIIQEKSLSAQSASLRLIDGNIYRSSLSKNTKIDFQTYDINLVDPIKQAFKEKSLLSLNYHDLKQKIDNPKNRDRRWRKTVIEFHKRWALSVGCILFALIGVGLGTTTNHRNVRSGNMVTCLGVIVLYWVLYVISENIGTAGHLPPSIAVWLSNFFFFTLTVWSLKRASH